MKQLLVWQAGFLACAAAAGALAQTGTEIGFSEEFALATNREAAIKQLVPGSDEFYFYTCLQLQNSGQLDKVDPLVTAWVKKHGETARAKEIRNRQALLAYRQNPQATVDYIQREEGLGFGHAREQAAQKNQFPARLDPQLIAYDKLAQAAFGRHALSGFTEAALEWLASQPLNEDQRRFLLQRLTEPDVAGLPEMILADLKRVDSGGFGSLNIHTRLTLEQLNALAAQMPELLGNDRFVEACVRRLRPEPDSAWGWDPAVKRACLERLWAFVEKLPASQTSLKAHVLFHRLEFDRTQNVFDQPRFLAYLKLPRNQFYVRPLYRQQAIDARIAFADLGRNYESWTGLKTVGNDEPLVRDYLDRFLVDAKDWSAFSEPLEENYLKEVFAESKLLGGVGEPDQWYNLMPPGRHQALRDRIDLALVPQNPAYYGVDETVKLRVAVKNVPRLTVQVFEIDAFHYYQNHDTLTTAIDLDGLAPGSEKVLEFGQAPMRRHEETLELPQITGRGVYVVELIGNGVSSRAVIRKGRLVCTQRVGSAGHVFTVLNEKREQVKDARLWVGGQEYAPDKDGQIAVPFTTGAAPVGPRTPARKGALVRLGNLAEPVPFQHEQEGYRLACDFWLDRESLVAGGTATLVVKPALLCAARPADLALLDEPVLEIRAVDGEGVASTQRKPGIVFDNQRELVHTFSVPEGTRRVEVSLRGKVRNITMTRDDDVSASAAFACNGQDATANTFACYLRHLADGWRIEVRGKAGEPKAAQIVNLRLSHRAFTEEVRATLQTDDNGQIQLGPLPGIVSLAAAPAGAPERCWALQREAADYDNAITVRKGDTVELPLETDLLAGNDAAPAASLFRLATDGSFAENMRANLALSGRVLTIKDLPAGQYRLRSKDTGRLVSIAVVEAPLVAGVLMANARVVVADAGKPPRIETLAADEKNLTIQLANATPATRVHLLARWSWADGVPTALGERTPKRTPVAWNPPQSLYVSGRNIGDEYRYILERRFAVRHAGNMLDRPSLLLAPWSVRDTASSRQQAQAGDVYDAVSASDEPVVMKGQYGSRSAGGRKAMLGAGGGAGFVESLDFLPAPALVLANLLPDAKGAITIERSRLGGRSQVYAVLCDGENWAARELALADAPMQPRDRALRRTLPAEQHLVERKIVTPLPGQGTLAIEDIRSTRLELYDSVGKVYRLFKALNDNDALREFAFITDWPKLPDEKKRELYGKYACHELNLFLFKKDPAFFNAVVRPFLAQKKDKQLVDEWLLGKDLARYLEPWTFGRLNAIERVLLARRIAEQQAAVARHIRERYELQTPDPESEARRFLTALQGGGLDEAPGGANGLALLRNKAKDAKRDYDGLPAEEMQEGVAFFAEAAGAAAAAPAAKPAAMARQSRALKEMSKKAAEADKSELEQPADTGGFLGNDMNRRREVRARYRSPDRTKEWVETQYYRVPLASQTPDLVPVNAFWADFAAHDGKTPFLSAHVTDAAGSFAEMMLALAVLDLPFEAGNHEAKTEETRLALKAGAPLLAFHLQTEAGRLPAGPLPLLVGQNFYALDDPFLFEGNEKLDKFVTGEFLAGRVYGARIVLTNPTSVRRKVEALLQIPAGAVPVQNGFYTRTRHVVLEPYATQTVDYFFYFPAAGEFKHYPVHASANGLLSGFAQPAAFHVVPKLTQVDETSWPYLSQNGTDEQVLAYLAKANVERLELEKIAFRMKEKAMFSKTLDLLRQRHVYEPVLWSYGLVHRDEQAIREYLRQSAFAARCGEWLDCELLRVDAAERWTYEHKEYWPLVNARYYQLGAKRTIQNDGLLAQYRAYMNYLGYRPSLGAAEQLAVAAYLLLQDRADEAARWAARVKPADVETGMQLDYLNAYLAFARGAPEEAKKIAAAYKDYPVPRWRNFFANVVAQADEISGTAGKVLDRDSREQAQDQLAATAPSLELALENTTLNVHYRNVAKARVSYYPMDLELMFSRSPFVRDDLSGRFSLVKPAKVEEIDLPAGKDIAELKLPAEFRSRNLLVEVEAGGVTARQVFTPHSLDVRFVQAYGQVLVRAAKSGKPLSAVYVKVYARHRNGSVEFYKDGYTDLRGRFDYASISTDDLDNVEKFAVLVMSDDAGAVVRETPPPAK
jgi:hypothetical protein